MRADTAIGAALIKQARMRAGLSSRSMAQTTLRDHKRLPARISSRRRRPAASSTTAGEDCNQRPGYLFFWHNRNGKLYQVVVERCDRLVANAIVPWRALA